jgi:hypothetical protein
MRKQVLLCAAVLAAVAIGLAVLTAPVRPAADMAAAAQAAEPADGGGPPPLVVDKDAPLLLDEPAAKTGTGSGEPPPLVIDKDAPLLLDGSATQPKIDPLAGPVADNEACYCCHANYREEEFVQYHAVGDVGCIDCHGQSHAHRNDENNTTPPDKMFAVDQIAGNCAECHDEHDVSAIKVIACWQERCPTKTDVKDIVCTDCHGQHRLKLRTVRWDKKTGELLIGQAGTPEANRVLPTEPPTPSSTTGISPEDEMQ